MIDQGGIFIDETGDYPDKQAENIYISLNIWALNDQKEC